MAYQEVIAWILAEEEAAYFCFMLIWSLSQNIESLKGGSSRKLRQDYADAISAIYYREVLWSPSYFAGSVGEASISVVRQYIEQQQEVE